MSQFFHFILSFFDLRTLSTLAISAFIGYITNVLAVKMIFHPRVPLGPKWLGIQGLVPKRQADLATAIGNTVQKHLISHADVQAILSRADVQGEMDELLRGRINTFIDEKLKTLNPMIAMFLTGTMKTKLEGILMDEIRIMMPLMSEKMMARVENELNFQAIIEERVRGFDLGKLEDIIYEISARELKAIEWLGGVLGFLIGLIQVAIIRF